MVVNNAQINGRRTLLGIHRLPTNQSGNLRMLPLEVNHLRIPDWRNLVAMRAVQGEGGKPKLYGIWQSSNIYSEVIAAPEEKPLDIPYPRHLAPPEKIKGFIKVNSYPRQPGMESYYLLTYEVKSLRSERLSGFINCLAIDETKKNEALQLIGQNQGEINKASAKDVSSSLLLQSICSKIPEGLHTEVETLWEKPPLYESDRFVHMPLPWFDIENSEFGHWLLFNIEKTSFGKRYKLDSGFRKWAITYPFKLITLLPKGIGYMIYVTLRHPLVNWTINFFRFTRYNQVDLWLNLIEGIKTIDQPRYEYKSPFWRFFTTFPLNLPGVRNYLNRVFEKEEGKITPFEQKIKRHIHRYSEIEITNSFPTNIAYPHHKGWLSSNNVFRLREQYTITDLANLVQYWDRTKGKLDIQTSTRLWVGPKDPSQPNILTWAPESPKDKTGWREVKNAGLGLLKIDGVDKQVVIPFEKLPHRLKNQAHARAVVEIVPIEGNSEKLEVIEAQMKPSSPDAPAKVDYRLSPNVSLEKLAQAQGCKWSKSFLQDEDFVQNLKIRIRAGEVKITGEVIKQSENPLLRATRFYVEIEYETNDPENTGKFVVPGEYFVDQDGHSLLQSTSQDLSDLRQIYQREDGKYNLHTKNFKPTLESHNGKIILNLIRVKRYKIDKPKELAAALEALKKSNKDLTGILFAMPTFACKMNDKFWIPLSLTKHVKSRFLDNVPALQYNFMFAPKKVASQDKDEQAKILKKFDERLEQLYRIIGEGELPVKIIKQGDNYKVIVEKDGRHIEIEAEELLDKDFNPLLKDPRMAWAREIKQGEWDIYLFRANDAIVLGMRKLHTHCGKNLPRNLPYFLPDFTNVYLHFVARQTLLFDEDIPASFATDIRDSFFYGRGANYVTDVPNDWNKTTSGLLADLFHFYAGLQIGERQNFDANAIPDPGVIENGTRYAGSRRTLTEAADIQGFNDGELGGVHRNLFWRFYKKLVNYGRPLGNVQAIGEDEQLKQAVRLLLGAALGYSFLDPSTALQEDAHGPIDVQDCQKYIATTDLVVAAFKRVIPETYYGRLKGERPISYTRGHIFKLFLQATWYYISYAEKNRKLAPMLFLLSAGHILPLPVDRTTFLQIFLLDMVASIFGYQFLRTVQGYGLFRSFISAPAKDLAFLGASSKAIQLLFPQKWEFGPFIASRTVAGTEEMPLHSKNLLAWYSMGEAAAVAGAGLHTAAGVGIKAGEGTSEGLFINTFWSAYAFILSRTGIGWQKAFEKYEIFRKTEFGKIPGFNLSSLPDKADLKDTDFLRKQLLTWRYEAIHALNQLDTYTKEYRKQAKLDKKLHKFLRSEYRQSILKMIQQVDMGLYILARQVGGTKEKAENRKLSFALLQLLHEDPIDQAVYRLARDAMKKIGLSESEIKELSKTQEILRAEIEGIIRDVKKEKLADVPQEVGTLATQVLSNLIDIRYPSNQPKPIPGSEEDSVFKGALESFVRKISEGRNFNPELLKQFKAIVTDLRRVKGNYSQGFVFVEDFEDEFREKAASIWQLLVKEKVLTPDGLIQPEFNDKKAGLTLILLLQELNQNFKSRGEEIFRALTKAEIITEKGILNPNKNEIKDEHCAALQQILVTRSREIEEITEILRKTLEDVDKIFTTIGDHLNPLEKLLDSHPDNYLCRLFLKSWLKKDPNLKSDILKILEGRVSQLMDLEAVQDKGEGKNVLKLIASLQNNRAISSSEAKSLRIKMKQDLDLLFATASLTKDPKTMEVVGTALNLANKPDLWNVSAFDPTDKSAVDLFISEKRAQDLITRLNPVLKDIQNMPEDSAKEIEKKLKSLKTYDMLMRKLLELKYTAHETHRPTLAREKILYLSTYLPFVGKWFRKKFPFNSVFNADEFLPEHNQELEAHLRQAHSLEEHLRTALGDFAEEELKSALSKADPYEQYKLIRKVLKLIHQYNLSEVFNRNIEGQALYAWVDPLIGKTAEILGKKFEAIQKDLDAGKNIKQIAKAFDNLTKEAIEMGFVNILFYKPNQPGAAPPSEIKKERSLVLDLRKRISYELEISRQN